MAQSQMVANTNKKRRWKERKALYTKKIAGLTEQMLQIDANVAIDATSSTLKKLRLQKSLLKLTSKSTSFTIAGIQMGYQKKFQAIFI